MAVYEVHKNDYGTVFRLTVKDNGVAVDISSATTKQIIFRKPSGTLLTKTATFTTTGTDGKLQYTTVSGDIDSVGTWYIQAKLTFTGAVYNSSLATFRVLENIE